MTDRAFVDANVFVYMFDADEPRKRAKARDIVDKGARDGTLVLSAQVLGEFYVTVTQRLAEPLSTADAARAVTGLCALPLLPVDSAIVLAAVARSRADQLDYWDALLVETARAGGCAALVTEDLPDGRDFDGLRVVNPFRG
jgi:predicted nucleic acid-binding protein